MITINRVKWGGHAARRIAAAHGILNQHEAERLAKILAPKVTEIAYAICVKEPRRGPREIALFILRQVAGRHAVAIPHLVINASVDDAAEVLLQWAEGGLLVAADNPRPARTPPRSMRLSVFHPDGRTTRWDYVVEPQHNGDPARQGGRR